MKKQKNYPLYEVQKFSDFREMLDLAVKAVPDKPAFKFKQGKEIKEITYTQFRSEVDTLSAALYSLGLENTHIACVGPNSYRWVNVYLSTLCCSGVYVPLDAKLPIDEIIGLVNDSDSEVFFYAKNFASSIESAFDRMPKVKLFVVFDGFADIAEAGDGAIGRSTTVDRLFAEGKKYLASLTGPLYTHFNEDNDMKMLVYTSGTTGIAKGVMLSQKNLTSAIYYGLQVSTVFDSCLSVLPYHHTYEAVCGLLVGLHMHVTICINESLRLVGENLKLFKPAYILLVPLFVESFYKRIWREAENQKKDKALKALIKLSNNLRNMGIDKRDELFKSVREAFGGNLTKLVCGGAPVRAELGKFFDDIGITLVNGYGITECSPLVSANRDQYNDCSTVGVTLPCCETKLDDPDEENTGEICVKGDIVMLGYYKNKKLTDEVLKDGWFHTGDYGSLDEENRLCIRGRKKNLIVLSNGENIYPEEIENYILSLSLVKEVVVSALVNSSGAEYGLCAEIFPNEEVVKEQGISDVLKALTDAINKLTAKMPTHKQITKIVVRTVEFSKTTSAKIKRNYSAKPTNA